MRYFLIFIGTLAFTAVISFQNQQQRPADIKPFAVEQLFTSQGCSSCPSADRTLENLKQKYRSNEQVVLLSYHVDYWDRLGWKDPYSKQAFTKLQKRYNSSSVYTPQAVINGREGLVGSKRSQIEQLIERYLKTPAHNGVYLTHVKNNQGAIGLDYKIDGELRNRKLVIALALENKITTVNRGENTGKTLSNNIVVKQKIIVPKHHGSVQIEVPQSINGEDRLLIAVFIQKEDLKITGAAKKHLR